MKNFVFSVSAIYAARGLGIQVRLSNLHPPRTYQYVCERFHLCHNSPNLRDAAEPLTVHSCLLEVKEWAPMRDVLTQT
jgi:hypothetical protein